MTGPSYTLAPGAFNGTRITRSEQIRKGLTALCAVAVAICAFGVEAKAGSRNGQRGFEPISLYSAGQHSSTFESCAQLFPGRQPISLEKVAPQWKARGLCSNSFAVLHSGLTKTPLVVIERLSRQSLQAAKNNKRGDVFFADPRLPKKERADLRDYARSGMDRGHLSPAANQPDAISMAQSFALSNMIPQDQINNRKIWAKLESDTRKFARRAGGDVYVFSGPLFRVQQPRTIGHGQIWVPTHLFKLVYDQASGRAWAHIVANTADAVIGRPISYDEFVMATGRPLLQRVRVKGSVAARRIHGTR